MKLIGLQISGILADIDDKIADDRIELRKKGINSTLTVTLNEIPNVDKYRRYSNKLPEELTVKNSTYCDRVVLEKSYLILFLM